MAKSTKSYEERMLEMEKKEQESLEKAKRYAAQKKELLKRKKAEESKKRTHRLCQVGGAVESVLGATIEEEDMKVNLREIIHYIDESTLEKAKNEKVQKQESPSKMSKDVEESVDKMISNRMSKAYSEWKSNQDTQPFNENIEKEYQKLLETLSPEQEEVLTKYCDEIFASGAETEEFFYRLGIKDGLRLKSTVKSVLEMMS